jgi:hypothetical protein
VVSFSKIVLTVNIFSMRAYTLSNCWCGRMKLGQLATPQWEGGVFYYIGPVGLLYKARGWLALQGKGNCLDLHLLTIATNP